MLLQRNASLPSTRIDDEIVVMCAQTGKYYALDGAALRIWELLEEPLAPEDIQAALLREYAVDADTCRHDTARFLADMQAKMLIQPAATTA